MPYIGTEQMDAFFAHHGIKKQKWGFRRFQNPDGSLTSEGRKRYLKGGEKQVKKLEKERARRQAILSDRKKLYKHKDEFTTEEINKAMERFAAQDRLKAQMDMSKEAKAKAKSDAARSKLEYKKIKAQTKLEKIKSIESEKQAKYSTEKQKLETEGKQKTADISAKAQQWQQRVNRAKSMWEFAQVGQSILSDMGITSKDGSESLLGALAESMGIKDTSAKRAAAAAKKERQEAKEITELRNAKAALVGKIASAYSISGEKLTKSELSDVFRKIGLDLNL